MYVASFVALVHDVHDVHDPYIHTYLHSYISRTAREAGWEYTEVIRQVIITDVWTNLNRQLPKLIIHRYSLFFHYLSLYSTLHRRGRTRGKSTRYMSESS